MTPDQLQTLIDELKDQLLIDAASVQSQIFELKVTINVIKNLQIKLKHESTLSGKNS